MSQLTKCSIDRLNSGVLRARKMYKGEPITYVGKPGEGEEEVRKKFDMVFIDHIKNGTVDESWKVEKWIDYWLKVYKKPIDYKKEESRKKVKGGKVTASSYSRLLQTYNCQIKETKYGKLLLRKQLRTVVPDDIQKVINELEQKGLADSTVKKAQELLGAAFKKAVENHYMLFNPAQNVIRNGKINEGKDDESEKVEILTASEITAFFEEALRVDEDGNPIYTYGAGVALQLAIGCRSGELRALDWKHVTENHINIQHSVGRVKNLDENDTSGRKTVIFISNTKSKSSRRKIPYTDGDIISKCLKILKKRCEGIPNKNDLVMPTSRGGYLTDGNYNKEVKRIVSNINKKEFASHSLRHSFISLLVNDENRDLATIASLVGHGDIRVTLHYAKHTNEEKKKETLNIISDLVQK